MAYLRAFSIGTHSVRRTGSSALNLAIVAAGGFDVCYATAMNPWDAAAGVVLVREAGGELSNLEGGPYDLYRQAITSPPPTAGSTRKAAVPLAEGPPCPPRPSPLQGGAYSRRKAIIHPPLTGGGGGGSA